MNGARHSHRDAQLEKILEIFEDWESRKVQDFPFDELERCFQELAKEENLTIEEVSSQIEHLRNQSRSLNAPAVSRNIPAGISSLFSMTTLLIVVVTVVISVLFSALERYFLHIPERLSSVYGTDIEEGEKQITQQQLEQRLSSRQETIIAQVETTIASKLQPYEARLTKLEQSLAPAAPNTRVTPDPAPQTPPTNINPVSTTDKTPTRDNPGGNSQAIQQLETDLVKAKEAQAYMTSNSSEQRTVFVICEELLKVDPNNDRAKSALNWMLTHYSKDKERYKEYLSQIGLLLQRAGQ